MTPERTIMYPPGNGSISPWNRVSAGYSFFKKCRVMDLFPGSLWRTVRSHNSKCVDDFWIFLESEAKKWGCPYSIHDGSMGLVYLPIHENHKNQPFMEVNIPVPWILWVRILRSMYLPKLSRWKWSASAGSSLKSLYAKTIDYDFWQNRSSGTSTFRIETLKLRLE